MKNKMLDYNVAELVERKYKQIDEDKKKKNEAYLNSPEWKNLLKQARTAKNKSYTVIYREPNGDLREAWHFLNDLNIESVKETYAEGQKEILYFAQKEKPFGDYLKSIHGGSKKETME